MENFGYVIISKYGDGLPYVQRKIFGSEKEALERIKYVPDAIAIGKIVWEETEQQRKSN